MFEPEFCRHLIGLYEQHGGEESGFMREIDGKTVAAHDPNHKRRKDYTIDDPNLIRQMQRRIIRRINPEIEKVHFFKPTRMERYIVSCYAAEDGGHFRAHRDNTTKGTAHRRFAVSINLNDDFEGGEVSFPEYGPRSYKAPPGGAVVFSCSLLHAVSQGHPGPPLRLPAVPLRRGGGEGARGEQRPSRRGRRRVQGLSLATQRSPALIHLSTLGGS